MKKYHSMFLTRMLITFLVTLFFALPAFAVTAPTEDDYKNMITSAQQYLLTKQTVKAVYDETTKEYVSGGEFVDSSYSYYPVAVTGSAVAALIESGFPVTDQHIVDAVNYLRKNAIDRAPKQLDGTTLPADYGKGGFGYSSYNGEGNNYETGIALMALSLYEERVTGGLNKVIIQNAADFVVASQDIDIATPVRDSDGGWSYNLNGAAPGTADLSNTQFSVMGLYYANRYLGKAIPSEPWAVKLFGYLQRRHGNDGSFIYAPYWSGSNGMTGAGLWSLFMIGRTTDDTATTVTDSSTPPVALTGRAMTQRAINYLKEFSWSANDSYYIFAVAKGLQLALGADNKLGTHDWVNGIADINGETINGLKYSLYNSRQTIAATATAPALTYWNDYGDVLSTSWRLQSLSFSVGAISTPDKYLPPVVVDPITHPELEAPPVDGNVVIKADLGMLIEQVKDKDNKPIPFREAVVKDQKKPETVLPVGAMNFQLINVPVGGTAEIRISVPEEAMNELHPNFDEKKAFVNKHGNKKFNISWYKVINGIWRPLKGVPIDIDKAAHVVIVTLKDGGPEDQDGLVNGVIADPGAPGFETVSASPAGDTYTVAQSVTLTADVNTKKIYYTTDGSDPTTASTAYTTPISIAANTTLKFISTDADGTNPSAVSTETYVINLVAPTPVNGSCGTSNGVSLASAPTSGFCATGTVTPISGSGPWTWSCNGTDGGTPASCSAALAPVVVTPTPINGSCGSSNGISLVAAPTTGLCSAGTATATSGSGPWTWSCNGTDGGTPASCSAALTPPAVPTFTVTASAATGSSISPAAAQTVNKDGKTTFTVTPAPGYGIATVSGCGGTLAGNVYTTGAITANCSVAVTAVARNGRIDAATPPSLTDALNAFQGSTGLKTLTAEEKVRYDVAPLGADGKPAGNGVVDIIDALMILRRSISIGSW